MSRTVTALYDSRGEAEFTSSRLISEFKIRPPRIIAKDTAGAIDTLKLDQKLADSYRERLRGGAHLLVAQVPGGSNTKQIIRLLQQAPVDHVQEAADQPGAALAGEGVGFRIADERPSQKPPEAAASAAAGGAQQRDIAPAPVAEPSIDQAPRLAAAAPQPPRSAAAPVEEEHIPVVSEELRIGRREVARGGARVRSFTREEPVEQSVSLNDEVVEVEGRPSERRLTDSEIEAGGMFKERVFEIAEMREEPVVTKVAVVREELIVRKTVKERTETIRDTVRHTEVEVEDIPAEGPALFGQTPDRSTRRR